jgi:hypothetical protein
MVYKVLPMTLQHEAIVVFNSEDMSITCSCRMFESIGMLAHFSKFCHINNTDYNTNYFIVGILCKHTIRVFNINEVFVLPTQYILHRFICGKQRRKNENKELQYFICIDEVLWSEVQTRLRTYTCPYFIL